LERFQSKKLKEKIFQKQNNFFALTRLFFDCFESQKKNLERGQKKVGKDQGLSGSLLFELIKSNTFVTDIELKTKNNNISKTNL